MFNNIGIVLVLLSLAYSIFLNIVFSVKKHVNSTEINIFSILMKSNLIGLILEMFCIITIRLLSIDNIITKTVNRIFLIYLFIFASLFTLYIIFMSLGKLSDDKKVIHQRVFKYYGFIVLLICIILSILPFNLYSDNGIYYSYGICVDVIYILCGISVVFCIFVLLKNLKNISKKYISLFVFVIGCTITTLIQKIFPEVTLATTAETFLILVMYHTIENPDVKMIEQLDIAKQNAEKANRAKSDFLSSMSHEIRTPLNAIVGFSECILTENNLADAKRDAKDIVMASQNLLEIVNGILDISKIEANKMEIVETDYHLVENLENIAKLMIPRIGEKPIELKTNFAVDIPYTLHGDGGKIKQIVTNILTNAVKYTEKGEINFVVSCINEGNICSLVISVEDTGRGIQSDKLCKLFSKFDRLDEDKNTTIEGTGLGLAITKSLVDMMGGNITVQSVYGEGSKFTVYLRQEIKEMSKTKEDEDTTIVVPDFKGNRILVVDDNKLNLRVADKLLK